jgi:hypothetical protein
MSRIYAARFPTNFPRLGNQYRKRSCATELYNCIAWAMSECHRPWWPGAEPAAYWPVELSPDVTIENFVFAFMKKGYQPCVGAHHEWRFEKIAIYADRYGEPAHAARSLLFGGWISKLGRNVDIRHESLEVLEGGLYGSVIQVMRRPRTAKLVMVAFVMRLIASSGIPTLISTLRKYKVKFL